MRDGPRLFGLAGLALWNIHRGRSGCRARHVGARRPEIVSARRSSVSGGDGGPIVFALGVVADLAHGLAHQRVGPHAMRGFFLSGFGPKGQKHLLVRVAQDVGYLALRHCHPTSPWTRRIALSRYLSEPSPREGYQCSPEMATA